MNTLHIVIDESGTFASGDNYFVFGGYAIVGQEHYNAKQRKYLSVERQVDEKAEVKANVLNDNQKQALLAVMKEEVSFGLAIKNKNLPTRCYTDGLAKAIIKDDLLKNIIIEVINNFDINQIEKINIEIDEQNLKFGIRQNLYIALYKELQSGYYNRNQYIKAATKRDLLLTVTYVDSTQNVAVRAADVLVNTVGQKLHQNSDVYTILKIFKVL